MELSKIRGFLKRYGTWILTGVLVILLGITVWMYVRNSARRRTIELQQEYDVLVAGRGADVAFEERVARLNDLAAQDDEGEIAALAAVALGDLHAGRALDAGPGPARRRQLDEAEQAYTRAQKRRKHPVAAAKGTLGLARVAEARGDKDRARELYERIAADESLAGEPVRVIADESLAELDAETEPVEFATTAPAEPVGVDGASPTGDGIEDILGAPDVGETSAAAPEAPTTDAGETQPAVSETAPADTRPASGETAPAATQPE